MIWKDHGELFIRHKKNPILTIEDWPYQANSVFNPAAAIVEVKLYYWCGLKTTGAFLTLQ